MEISLLSIFWVSVIRYTFTPDVSGSVTHASISEPSEQRWYIFDNRSVTPPNRRSGHGMAAIGPKIYVLGGRCSPQDENTIHVLDTRA